jgi:hypothetical protein
MFGAGFNPAAMLRAKGSVVDAAPSEDSNNAGKAEETAGASLSEATVENSTLDYGDDASSTKEVAGESPKGPHRIPPPMEDADSSDDDIDGMFSAPAKHKEESKSTKNDIFGFGDTDDEDDDGLFSNMAAGVKPSMKPNPLANILGDDSDDDLFSSLISKSSK